MPLPRPVCHHRFLSAFALAGILLAALAAVGIWVTALVRIVPGTPIHLPAARGPVRVHAIAPPQVEEGPTWNALTARQQQALAPLQQRWPLLSEAQKLHWLKLALHFHTLPLEEQARIQVRLTDWANLSAQQRSQARLNYAVTSRLAPESKRAQWEAYQALAPETRQQLAATAAPKPAGAATAVRPVARKKLARVPAASHAAHDVPNPPKIRPPAQFPAPQPLPPPVALPDPVPAAAVQTAPVHIPSAVAEPLPSLESSALQAPADMADSAPDAAPSAPAPDTLSAPP